jgi:hypothetical protein
VIYITRSAAAISPRRCEYRVTSVTSVRRSSPYGPDHWLRNDPRRSNRTRGNTMSELNNDTLDNTLTFDQLP